MTCTYLFNFYRQSTQRPNLLPRHPLILPTRHIAAILHFNSLRQLWLHLLFSQTHSKSTQRTERVSKQRPGTKPIDHQKQAGSQIVKEQSSQQARRTTQRSIAQATKYSTAMNATLLFYTHTPSDPPPIPLALPCPALLPRPA